MNSQHFEIVMVERMMHDQSYLGKIAESCDPAYFQDRSLKTLATKILEFYKKRFTLPNKTEILVNSNDDEVKFVEEALSKISMIDSSYDADELLTNTETFMRERATYNALVDVTENLSSNDPRVKKMTQGDILDKFTKACTLSVMEDNGFDFIEGIKKFTDELATRHSYISTGFKFLDEKLNGGWQEGGKAIYVCSGQTNVGKSIFLGQFATAAFLAGKVVVLISLEMSEMMYTSRIVANVTKFDINSLPMYTQAIEGKIGMLEQQGAGKLIIKEFPTKSTTVAKLSSYLEQLERSGIHPDLVVVDYLNLMSVGSSVSGTYEEVKVIIEQMRSLTYKFNCPFVTATQINRSGFGKENPGMENLSESVGTAYTADAMFSVWQTEEDKNMGIMHMSMQKNRFGANSGTCSLKIDYPTMTIEELDSEESEDDAVKSVMSSSTPQKSVMDALEEFMS